LKALNILLLAFAVLLLASAGAGLLALILLPGVAAGMREAHELLYGALQTDPNLRWGLLLLGAAFLLLAFVAVWGNISTRRWERTVVLHNPLGEVMVSLAALEDIGRLAKGDVAGVKDLKLQVLARRRGLQATVRVVLYSDANVPSTRTSAPASWSAKWSSADPMKSTICRFTAPMAGLAVRPGREGN
jgi:hypothetical protein